MAGPSKYNQAFRQRAVRLVLEQREEYPSGFEAIKSVRQSWASARPRRCASGPPKTPTDQPSSWWEPWSRS